MPYIPREPVRVLKSRRKFLQPQHMGSGSFRLIRSLERIRAFALHSGSAEIRGELNNTAKTISEKRASQAHAGFAKNHHRVRVVAISTGRILKKNLPSRKMGTVSCFAA